MNTFIFDLDGTLLPMANQELFLEEYFKALAKKMLPHGLDPQKLMKAVWVGTKAMIDNDGSMTNEQRFWDVFSGLMGDEVRELEPVFDNFYRNEFIAAKSATSYNPLAKECVKLLKKKGYMVALATNPLFPQIATYTRMEWAGLDPKDFEIITTYEKFSYCKPSLEYYKEILKAIDRAPEECIMVGNDVKEDMCVAKIGMDTFLLKDCLICTEEDDLDNYRQGNFEDLIELINNLPNLSHGEAV